MKNYYYIEADNVVYYRYIPGYRKAIEAFRARKELCSRYVELRRERDGHRVKYYQKPLNYERLER